MWLWTGLAVLGTYLGHYNPQLHLPVLALLLPTALAALALRAPRLRTAFRQCFWVGTLAATAGIYWIAIAVHDYGYFPWWLALPCPFVVAAYLGASYGLFGLALRWGQGRLSPLLLGLLAGCAWATLEWLREFVGGGFPWLPLAVAFAGWPWAIQAVSLMGAPGLGALLTACVVWWLTGGDAFPWRLSPIRLLALALLAGVAGFGLWRMQTPTPPGATAQVGYVQANIDQGIKWSPGYQAETVDRFLTLSRNELGFGPLDLLVWPETAMPFYFGEVSELTAEVRTFVRQMGIPLLTGAPAARYDPVTKTEALYNRAYLLDAAGQDVGHYDKARLVPFGEYVPLGKLLHLSSLFDGIGDFEPGTDVSPLRVGNLAMGMLICYEAIFTDLAQERVALGANLLVSLSNDTWYGHSSAPGQTMHQAVLRAVEQGRWMVRATSTGVSSFIDDRGRVQDPTPLFVVATARRSVGLSEDTTLYHRIYPALRLALPLATGVLLLLVWRRGRSARGNFEA